jgi:hypothetical protein
MLSSRTSLVVAALVLAIGGAISALAVPAAAADMPFHDAASFTVGGTERLDIAGLMPGETMPAQVLTLHATGTVAYRLRPETEGSVALARTLHVRIVAESTGLILYEGTLADAIVDATDASLQARTLRDASERLVMTTSLPLSAGNDVQGATLTVYWIVDATEVELA